MAKHRFVSAVTDSADATEIRTQSDWNDTHIVGITSISGNTTLANTHDVLLCTAGAGGITVTLPTAVGRTGQIYLIKKVDSGAGAVRIATTSSQTIDGLTYQFLYERYSFMELASDGSNWAILRSSLYFIRTPHQRRFGMIIAGGIGATETGDIVSVAGATNNDVAPTAAEPVMRQSITGGVSGNAAGQSGQLNYRIGRNIFVEQYVQLFDFSLGSQRAWIALTDQTGTTMVGSDNPAGNYVGFRYSTVVPDTNFQAITKDGTTQNVIDTGIAADGIGHKFSIYEEPGASFVFAIDGAIVARSTANLPTSGTNCKVTASISTQTAAARTIRIGWQYAESDK